MQRKVLAGMTIFACMLLMGAGTALALTNLEKLGGLIYRDTNLSSGSNQSCMTCHHPSAGFADPENRRDPVNFPVSEGSLPGVYGGRNAPSAAYAGFSPILAKDGDVWKGGMFWDGRATGERLGDPLAEQALGPFVNEREMNLNEASVVQIVAAAPYSSLFLQVYPGTDFNNIQETYDNIGKAIAAFERSSAVTRFTSKFDRFWRACRNAGVDASTIGVTTPLSAIPKSALGILTTRQLQGLALFNGAAGCAACHTTTAHTANGKTYPPLFTDYTYDNLGLPTNATLYWLFNLSSPPDHMASPPDLGLGGFLNDATENGKFKVPTLRNVAKSPPYGHNGYFPTLLQVVHFYNTRDVASAGWPLPEYPLTMNVSELGNLGLTADQEWSLVVFMQSLNDEG